MGLTIIDKTTKNMHATACPLTYKNMNTKAEQFSQEQDTRSIAFAMLQPDNAKDLGQKLKCTRMCKFVEQGKTCPRKTGTCRFAHTSKELVVPECFFGNKCKYMNSKTRPCKFRHPEYSNSTHEVKHKVEQKMPTANFFPSLPTFPVVKTADDAIGVWSKKPEIKPIKTPPTPTVLKRENATLKKKPEQSSNGVEIEVPRELAEDAFLSALAVLKPGETSITIHLID